MKKLELPKYCFEKNHRIWFTLKGEDGKWKNLRTPYTITQVDQAARYVRAMIKGVQERLASKQKGELVVTTFREYCEKWLADRVKRGIPAATHDDPHRLEHAYPHIGDLAMEEVRPIHIRDMVRALVAMTGDQKLAPRTIHHVYHTVRSVFNHAVVDELILANPCVVKRGELPARVDADPEWRVNATYQVYEIERLITDPIIPAERRVQYAFKALAGMRHGEVAALCFRHVDETYKPLAKIKVVQAWDSRDKRIKDTKTKDTREVPMHPTLAKIFRAWRDEHWERIYGRRPGPDDHVVPTRNMTPVDVADAGHALNADLTALGLRREAGKTRRRGGHDMRGFYETQLLEDDAESLIIARTTHAPPKTVKGGYQRFSWGSICREVTKLSVSTVDGEILPLLTSSLPLEKRASARWTSVVTPKRLEPVPGMSKDAYLTGAPDEKLASIALASAHERSGEAPYRAKARPLSTGLKMLERAVRSGDTARAVNILAELQQINADEG